MKPSFKHFVLLFAALVATGWGGITGLAMTPAYTTVSPAVTSNTYGGLITLNIAGLTNSEKVIVQEFIDANTNGLIDSFEPMMDTFKITDGTTRMIQPLHLGSSQFTFSIMGSVGVNYTVQVSTNLVSSSNWANLQNFQIVSNYFIVVDPQATNSPRYYRILKN